MTKVSTSPSPPLSLLFNFFSLKKIVTFKDLREVRSVSRLSWSRLPIRFSSNKDEEQVARNLERFERSAIA
jgi:hypothetical protein